MTHGPVSANRAFSPDNNVSGLEHSCGKARLTSHCQSRSFVNLAAATDTKPSVASSLAHFDRVSMSKPWGTTSATPTSNINIWGSGSGSLSNGLTSTAATRDHSRSRDSSILAHSRSRDGSTRAGASHAEKIEGKTGSGSLVDNSVLDDTSFRFRPQRETSSSHLFARGAGVTPSQARSTSNAGIPSGPTAATAQSTYLGWRTQEYTLNVQPRPGVSMPPSANSYKSYMNEPPPTVYTKFDRPSGPAPKPELANGSWVDSMTHPSPTDTRGSFSTQHFARTMTTSREPSQPPSVHSNDHFSFAATDHSHTTQRTTPNSSRAPSLSSQRNSAYSPYPSHLPDSFTSDLGRMKLNGDSSRPSTSYKSPSSRDGHQNRSSGINPDAPVFGGGFAGGRPTVNAHSDDIVEIDRPLNYPPLDGYPQPHGFLDYYNPAFAARYAPAPERTDYRNSAQPAGNEISFRVPDEPRSSADWHNMYSPQGFANRRSPGFPDPRTHVDPRYMQQLLAAHAAMYNPYAMSGGLQFGGHPSFMSFLPMSNVGLDPHAGPRALTAGDGVQSALLYEFKTQVKGQHWELKDIHDHIAEFAGDQHGSRFIQTKLETANSDEKDRVFREIQPNAIQLMTDVFGNYVIQKFFENGDQTHKRTLANKMQGQVMSLSFQMYGCRVVQKALDYVLVDQQARLVKELEGNVMKCLHDQNGNHVIQKAIERCPPHTIAFIIAAFQGQVQSLSNHAYGCRVIQRCLERCEPASKKMIMDELMEGIQNMTSDQYGNYVVQHIVLNEEGLGRQRVLDIVIKNLENYSKHKYASNVVEKCLEAASDSWRREVLYTLSGAQRRVEGDSVLVGMLKDSFGNYVIREYSPLVEHPAMLTSPRKAARHAVHRRLHGVCGVPPTRHGAREAHPVWQTAPLN